MAVLLFMIWRPEFSVETEQRWVDILRVFPLYVAVRPENEAAVQEIIRPICEEARHAIPLEWKGKTYTYAFESCVFDHGAGQKVSGNFGGNAHRRCECCGADFSDLDKMWSFAQSSAVFQKTLPNVQALWNSADASERAKGAGLKSRSCLLPSTMELEDPYVQKWVENFIPGQDNLHNIKGHLHTILDRLQKDKSLFDTEKFKELSETLIQRRATSEFDASHWRELAVSFREVILPAIITKDPTVRAQYESFFHHWTEVFLISFFSEFFSLFRFNGLHMLHLKFEKLRKCDFVCTY